VSCVARVLRVSCVLCHVLRVSCVVCHVSADLLPHSLVRVCHVSCVMCHVSGVLRVLLPRHVCFKVLTQYMTPHVTRLHQDALQSSHPATHHTLSQLKQTVTLEAVAGDAQLEVFCSVYSVLQRIAGCCSVLHCVAVCCRVLFWGLK